MRRTLLFASLAALAAMGLIGLVACRGSAQPESQDYSAAGPTVKIDNFSFAPATLTVAAGATVTWINQDDIPHTVVSTEKVFKSKALDTDEKFSYTFSKPGEFPYFCSIHPKMTGKIIVQ